MYYVMGLLESCFGYLKVGFKILHKKVVQIEILSSEGIENTSSSLAIVINLLKLVGQYLEIS
jgi:hypothetical protein